MLIPKFPLLKEWAYAGFFFAMARAVLSHLAVADEAKEFFGPTLIIILTVVSWYYRPAGRKVIQVGEQTDTLDLNLGLVLVKANAPYKKLMQ